MRFANFFHSLFSWALATLVVCVALVVFYYYHRGDEELRRFIEQAIAKECIGHDVKIGSANLIRGDGIRLREISVVQSGARQGQTRAEIMFCDEVFLHCNPTIQELLEGRVKIRRVLLRGLQLQPTRLGNGTWNFSELIPPQSALREIPTFEVENARIELMDYAVQQPTQLTLSNVNASVSPSVEEPGKLVIDSSFDSQHFQRAALSVTLDPRRPGSWSGDGQITHLNCNDALRRALTMQSVPVPPLLDGLRAVAQVRFSLAKGATEPFPRFQVHARISNGKYEAPRFLAHPVTDITIPLVKCTSDGREQKWEIRNATANYGTSRLSVVTAWGPSFSPGTDINANLSVDNLNITREMVGILPAKQQELWKKFQPLGVIDVKSKVIRSRGRWLTNANATCKGISLQCDKFQYPLTRCFGSVSFQQGRVLNVDLWAAPDQTWKTNPIHILADVRNPGKNFTGEIRVGMLPHTWLPIDARVRNAIAPAVRKVLGDMAAHGELNFSTVLHRISPDQPDLAKETHIEIRHGALKHERFPYPLQDVSGKIHLKDSVYRFTEFSGYNDSCVVTCEGQWQSQTAIAPSQLALEFVARNIPCDTELREALPPGPRQIWRDLRPAGTIEYAVINLDHRAGMTKPEIDIVVKQSGIGNDPDQRSLELQPTWFPLSMDRVTGKFRFSPSGEFSLSDIEAEHGSLQRTVKLRTSGGGVFREDGSWEILLNRVIADGIQTTPEFIAALPKNLRDALRTLKFQGILFVNAEDVRFAANRDPNIPIQASWSSTIDVTNGQFVLARQPVSNLFGEVRVSGRREQGGWINSGQATFDTLMCKGIHVTNLHAPWYMDSSRFVYGDAVRLNGRKSQPATAEVFGGRAQGTGQVNFTDDVDFGFNLALSDFDAGHDELNLPRRISGRGDARLTLQGNSQGNHTLRGEGGIQLRDANLAKLPAIIALVNTLRISSKSRPDAFTASNINFRIDGPTAYFDNFDLHGDSLSLKGQGRMEFDQRVYLKFYSLLGGESSYFQPFKLLAKQTSENLLQIFVTGTVDNLKVSQEMGPGWKELFPGQPVIANPRARQARR